MGHQLWTSPITGYRRKGTRLAELREVIDAGITARAILEPLQSCAMDAPACEIAQILRDREFDVAGVHAAPGEPVTAFVELSKLTGGAIREHMTPMTARELISDTTPIPTLLSVLRDRQRVFVLIGPDVKGLVTRSDLNKPPFRIYLFGIISLLEMHLSFWVRQRYDDMGVRSRMTPKRVAAAERLEGERSARGEETDLIDCLQMCDKRDLLLKVPEVCEALGLVPAKKARARLKDVESLRNLLAHNQADLTTGSSWEEVIDHVEWIELVVHKSDEHVEANAKTLAAAGRSDIWSAA
jgi:hypothetical protein